MGKKDQTSTTSQTQAYTPTGASQLQDIWNKIQGVTSQSYQPYSGQIAAGLDPTQQAGINTINSAVGTAQPYFDKAAQYGAAGAAPISASDIQRYQSPYTQQVIDATQRQFADNNAQQQQQVIGNAALQGALGGDRVGVAQAELARQQKLAQDPTIAGLYNQGYTQALGAAQADRAAQAQGAYTFGALAPSVQNTALQGGQAQLGAGQVGQNTSQNALTANYQQYLQQQAFPYQQAQFLAQYGLPTVTAMGGTQSGQGTQTTPGPSPWGQLIGLGTTAFSAFSDKRVKDNIEKVGKTFDGQNIYSYNYKGDTTPQMGLMAQEVEKKTPEAVGEVSGIKTVNYKKATAKAVKKGKFARGGAVDYSDVTTYIPAGSGQIADLTPKMTPMQMPGSGQGSSGYTPSASDLKGFAGGAKSLFGGIGDLFPSQGGNYAANMAGPAMIGNTGTGMVIGGLKRGGRVGGHGYALGGYIPNYIEGSESPISIPPVDPDRPMKPTLVGAQSDNVNITPFGARWSGDSPSPFSGTSLSSVPADVAVAPTENAAPIPTPIPTPRPQPVTGLAETPANARVTNETPTAGYSNNIDRYGNAISGIESGGKYDALGPVINKTGDRAYGKYQIMGANIPEWTKEILGKPMTPQEFLANPHAQDAVFKGKFGQYVNKYGPEGASRAWFAGEGGMNNPMARDQLGTTVADYSKRFSGAAGLSGDGPGTDVAAIPPNATLTQATGAQNPSSLGGWNPLGLSDEARTALMSAGLGMMASKSPFALTQIGEGGLQGMKSYQDIKAAAADRAMKARQYDLQAQNMARQAEQFATTAAETKRYHDILDQQRKDALSERQTRAGYIRNPDGTMTPIKGGPADPEQIAAVTKAKMTGAMLPDDTADFLAERVLAGDTKALVGLGRGAQGAENITKVQGLVARKAAERNMNPQDILAKTAEQSGLTAQQRTFGTQVARMAVNSTEAQGAIELGRQASAAVPRTNWVPVNKAIQAYQSGTSDPKLAQFGAANLAIINTYARAISPTGQPTVNDKKHAEQLLSTATGPDAYNAVLDQMNKEIEIAHAAPLKAKKEMENIRKSGQEPSASALQVPGNAQDRKVGTIYSTPKGNFRWNGSGWEKP